jgi:hypothetical protein
MSQSKLWDRIEKRTRPESRRRFSTPTVVSIVAHALLIVALAHAFDVPRVVGSYFFPRRQPTVVEKITYVTQSTGLPAPTARARPRPTPPPAAPATEPVRAPIVAPRDVPTGVREAPDPPTTPPITGPTSGPLVTGKGATRGVQPNYNDPRVWVRPTEVVEAPKTEERRLDSAVAATAKAYRDSVAASTYNPNKFERGDWTVERGGRKYGIDKQFIRLGPVSIPTALLAFLPMNGVQGNPVANDRDKAFAAMRNDIQFHAQRAMNEEEFRAAVKAIRERKEKERKAQLEKKKKDEKTIASPPDGRSRGF